MHRCTFCDLIYDIFWLNFRKSYNRFFKKQCTYFFLANLKNGSTRCKIWKSKLEILLPILNDIDWILFQKKKSGLNSQNYVSNSRRYVCPNSYVIHPRLDLVNLVVRPFLFTKLSSVGTNSKIPNFEHSNFGMSELRTPRTYGRKFKSNSNFKGRTSNFYKDK